VLIQDSDVKNILHNKIIEIAGDEKQLKNLSENAKKLSRPEAANIIAKSAINYVLSV
jgi:UDP-N-acetylglucosamine:LPS N-acetylglucosamine transferase